MLCPFCGTKSVKFEKPTVKEIDEYAKSIGFKLDAEYFWHFYEAVGWMRSDKPMIKWRSVVQTWKIKAKQPISEPPKQTPKVVNSWDGDKERKKLDEEEKKFNADWQSILRLPADKLNELKKEAEKMMPKCRLKNPDSFIKAQMVNLWRDTK